MYAYYDHIVIKLHYVKYMRGRIVGKKLLKVIADKIRFKHYSISTEKIYVHWAKRYILYHNKRHPKDMGKIEIEQFFTHLATKLNVSPTTQNQVLNSLLFLYEQVLNILLKNQNIQALRILKQIKSK